MALISIILGLAAGALMALLVSRMGRANAIARAEREANDILLEAKEEAEHLTDEAKLAADEATDAIWSKYEKEIGDLEERVKTLDEEYRKKRSAADRAYNQDSREVQK
ncbi:MAG: DUF3552 domain-containing protein, partial [Proteobacteria bacterium]